MRLWKFLIDVSKSSVNYWAFLMYKINQKVRCGGYVMDKREAAGQDYAAGMKYKDILAKYDVPVGTLKSWRTRDGWKKDASATKQVHPKRKKMHPRLHLK